MRCGRMVPATGKTRAAYKAVARDGLARRRLEYPPNAVALKALLEARLQPERCCGWASCASKRMTTMGAPRGPATATACC
jgi:hypothetical protein